MTITTTEKDIESNITLPSTTKPVRYSYMKWILLSVITIFLFIGIFSIYRTLQHSVTLEEAIKEKNEDLVLKIVKKAVDKATVKDVLHLYCDTFEFLSVKEYLLSTDSKIQQNVGKSVESLDIFDACKFNKLLAVKVFVLITKVDINAKDKDGRTALHLASSFGHIEIVEFLVGKDCDIDKEDKFGMTALHFASEYGYKEVVEFLVGKGCDINATGIDGMTALHWASLNDFVKVVEFLVGKGCDINATGIDGMTALHWASLNDFVKVVEFLANSKGCDINAKDENEMTALHFASEYGHIDIVQFLVGKGCDIDKEDKFGRTALHFASANDHKNIVQFLNSKSN